MNYRKSVNSSKVVTVVNGEKHNQKDIYVRENIGDKTTFLKHMEVGNKSKTMAGTTYDDRMAVVTRVSNGKRVKYSSDVVKSANNLRRVLKKSLRLNKNPIKTTKGKVAKRATKGNRATKGKVAKRATKGKTKKSGRK